jgi:hypothetical protein
MEAGCSAGSAREETIGAWLLRERDDRSAPTSPRDDPTLA